MRSQMAWTLQFLCLNPLVDPHAAALLHVPLATRSTPKVSTSPAIPIMPDLALQFHTIETQFMFPIASLTIRIQLISDWRRVD